MPSKTAVKMRNEDVSIELPLSMIDVTFLLLIFFMCSMQFKTVEQKLDANLPKNEGQNPIEAGRAAHRDPREGLLGEQPGPGHLQ